MTNSNDCWAGQDAVLLLQATRMNRRKCMQSSRMDVRQDARCKACDGLSCCKERPGLKRSHARNTTDFRRIISPCSFLRQPKWPLPTLAPACTFVAVHSALELAPVILLHI